MAMAGDSSFRSPRLRIFVVFRSGAEGAFLDRGMFRTSVFFCGEGRYSETGGRGCFSSSVSGPDGVVSLSCLAFDTVSGCFTSRAAVMMELQTGHLT